MKTETLLQEFRGLGGEIRLMKTDRVQVKYPASGVLPELVSQLRDHKEEIRALLMKEVPVPYLHRVTGDLVIPFECLGRFRWWDGGMTSSDTREWIERYLNN